MTQWTDNGVPLSFSVQMMAIDAGGCWFPCVLLSVFYRRASEVESSHSIPFPSLTFPENTSTISHGTRDHSNPGPRGIQ
jgi:hypothetical protein